MRKIPLPYYVRTFRFGLFAGVMKKDINKSYRSSLSRKSHPEILVVKSPVYMLKSQSDVTLIAPVSSRLNWFIKVVTAPQLLPSISFYILHCLERRLLIDVTTVRTCKVPFGHGKPLSEHYLRVYKGQVHRYSYLTLELPTEIYYVSNCDVIVMN